MNEPMCMIEPRASYDDALILRLTTFEAGEVVNRQWWVVSFATYRADGLDAATHAIHEDDLPS